MKIILNRIILVVNKWVDIFVKDWGLKVSNVWFMEILNMIVFSLMKITMNQIHNVNQERVLQLIINV